MALALILLLAVVAHAQTGSPAGAALIGKLKTPDHRINSIAYSPDGKLIAAGYGFYDQGGITVWNAATRDLAATLDIGGTAKAGIARIAFAPDGKQFAAASDKGHVFVWSVGNWQNYKTVISGGEDKSTDLAFSPDASMLAVAREKSAVVYDLASAKTSEIVSLTKISPYGISFTPDGKYVVVSSSNSIMTWSVEKKAVVNEWNPRTFGFFGRVSDDGKLVIAGGGAVFGEKSVKIWGFPEGDKIGDLTGFRSGLFSLAIAHSGKYFALGGGTYGSGGGTVSLWGMDGLKELAFVSFGESPVFGLAFSPDDKVLAVGSFEGFVLLYDLDKFRGPEVKKQNHALCAEVVREKDEAFLVPLSKVPRVQRMDFEYNWKLKIANAESAAGLDGKPVALEAWGIKSFAATDRVRINKLLRIGAQNGPAPGGDYIVFGEVQNPGWNTGSIAKIYSDGTYVVTNNPGECIAYGALAQLNTDFDAVKKRLVLQGLLGIPKYPLTSGAAHFRTRFITLFSDGNEQVRSDSGPAKKSEDFDAIYTQEQPFIEMLVKSGRRAPGGK